jgi:HAMP domain-containing protein
MLKNLSLSTKLNVLLLLIFFAIVIISGSALSLILEGQAQQEIASKAFVLIEAMSSVREYTDTQINPELSPRLDKETRFLPQTVPAYSAREVFDNLRKRGQYSDLFYKEATLNPTNPRDKADKFEATLVERFRKQPDLKQLTGFRSLPSGDIFYVARPLAVTEQSCLQCHSTPEVAPKSQIATYGRENGFGWKLNEIIGTQVISVPASQVMDAAHQLKFWVIGSLIVFFMVAILLINLFLKYTVTRPLKRMAQLSKQVSTGNMSGEFEHPANDEIGILAASLNRMKISLEMAMNMLNPNSNL